MGSIIFTAIEVLIIGAGLYLVPFFALIFLTVFFLGYNYFVFKNRKIIYYIIPVLFLLRIFFSVNLNEIEAGRIVKIETSIGDSRGRIERLDNRLPLEMINILTEEVPDGKYILYGTIEKIYDSGNFYTTDIIRKEEILFNRFEIFFNNKLETLKKHISIKCGNFLQGVILGERRYIHKNIRDKFIYCGSAHLLAISGLHIGAVISIILWCVNIFGIRKEIKYSLALLFLTIYVLGINTGPSVMRAYIMGAVFLIGKIFYEKSDIKKSFAAAIVINFFLYPNSMGNIAFLMSYTCLFTIIYIYSKCIIMRDTKYKNLLNFLIFTGVIQIFIIPLNLYFFKTLPLLSYFSNLFITPVGMLFVTLGFISFFVPEIIFVWIIAPVLEKIYILLELMLNFFSRIPYLIIKYDNRLPLKIIIFAYIILIILFYRKETAVLFKGREQETKNV